jgi:hypothetical protein
LELDDVEGDVGINSLRDDDLNRVEQVEATEAILARRHGA